MPDQGALHDRLVTVVHIRKPIPPMLATPADDLPEGPDGAWFYQPKLDGFRAMAIVDDHGGVMLYSRQLRRLNEAFPEVVLAVFDQLPPGTVVDGELVRYSGGRTDFAALQRRQGGGRRAAELARTQPAHFMVFDVVEARGVDLRSRPLRDRLKVLQQLLGDAPGTSLVVASPTTTSIGEARLQMEVLAAQGVEGIVAKRADQNYEAGKRRWLKIKRRDLTTAIVAGIIGSRRRPSSLLLGRYASNDHGGRRLLAVGRTSPLPDPARAEVGALLTPAGRDHPWPVELPVGWAGGLPGTHPPIRYTRVAPRIAVEISVDVATSGLAWRHLVRYVDVLPDLSVQAVPLDLDL